MLPRGKTKTGFIRKGHRHVFLNPDPDPAASWAQRKRMFALPTSSWDSYDRGVISPGGGVYSRTLKAVPLSAEVKTLLDLKVDQLTPAELILAILKARVELLYLGGIGTYVKGAGMKLLSVHKRA